MSILRGFVLLFGILNAILYSSLLPLWEGFDEWAHYAAVQNKAAKVSREVQASLDLAPMHWQATGIKHDDYWTWYGSHVFESWYQEIDKQDE